MQKQPKMKSIQKYRNTAKKIEKKYGLQVVDSSKITYEILVHRKNKVIIERCIGKVTNRNRDGKILNGNGKSSYYISYKGIKCKKNDIVISYFLWNPENNIEDDIIARWDFVVKK